MLTNWIIYGKGNVANGASFPKECASNDLGGNVYRGLGPGDTDPPQPGQQNQQQQQQGNYNNNQGGGNFNPAQGQSFPAKVTGGSGGKQPQCSCTCVWTIVNGKSKWIWCQTFVNENLL